MKKKNAQQLNTSIKNYVSDIYKCRETLAEIELTQFHSFADGKPCLGAYLIEKSGVTKLWFLLIDWKKNENYYLTIYSEDKQQVLAELHSDQDLKEPSELYWKYIPRKRDGKNDLRKQVFKTQCRSLELTVSLPGKDITVDEFFDDIFNLIKVRLASDDTKIKFPIPAIHTEGRRVWKYHQKVERSAKAVEEAKKIHRANHDGKSPCELCQFDFSEKYGSVGQDFIEAHHKEPLHTLKEGELRDTRASDFLMLCANCHRIVHRSGIDGNLDKMRAILAMS